MSAGKEPEFERMFPVADGCNCLAISNETAYSWIRKTNLPDNDEKFNATSREE